MSLRLVSGKEDDKRDIYVLLMIEDRVIQV